MHKTESGHAGLPIKTRRRAGIGAGRSGRMLSGVACPQGVPRGRYFRHKIIHEAIRLSQDAAIPRGRHRKGAARNREAPPVVVTDRKGGVEGKGVSVRVDSGGGRIIKKKNKYD